MNLESYVSTLEQSKKLDALLGKRESIFCWFRCSGDSQFHIRRYEKIVLAGYESICAYTSQELKEEITKILGEDWMQIHNHEPPSYHSFTVFYPIPRIKTCIGWEAAALAEFLIYLLEKKDE